MTPTRKIVYDTRRKRQSNNAGAKAREPLVDVIAAINQAYHFWFTQLVTVAERDSKARDDIRVFEVKNKELVRKSTGEHSDVFSLPDDHYKRLNQYAVVSKDSCCPKIKKRVIIRYVHPDKMNEALQNPYRNASFEYEQLPGDEAGHELHVHHQGAMKIERVTIDYYRTPGELHAPSLIKCADDAGRYYDYNGRAVTQDTDFEPIGRFSDQQISDLAAIILADSSGDYQQLQAKLQLALSLNTLYTN